jgi:metal-responsive CopG/Arc/MetJ family transcriptional regulator
MAGTSVSLPADLNYRLDRIAYEDRKSRSEVIQEALRLLFEKRDKEIQKALQRKGA